MTKTKLWIVGAVLLHTGACANDVPVLGPEPDPVAPHVAGNWRGEYVEGHQSCEFKLSIEAAEGVTVAVVSGTGTLNDAGGLHHLSLDGRFEAGVLEITATVTESFGQPMDGPLAIKGFWDGQDRIAITVLTGVVPPAGPIVLERRP